MPVPGNAPPQKQSPLRLTRRGVLVAGSAVLVMAGIFGVRWFNLLAVTGDDTMTPAEVHAAAADGSLLLIDVRRPDEWQRTGVGEGAVPIDMRRDDFEAALLRAAGGDKARPVALICARGVRTRRLSARLSEAGFTRIIDVPEGMLGSGAGPGWISRGLPVVEQAS